MVNVEIAPDGTIKVSDASNEQLYTIIQGVHGHSNLTHNNNNATTPVNNNQTNSNNKATTIVKKSDDAKVKKMPFGKKPSVIKAGIMDMISKEELNEWQTRGKIITTLRQRGLKCKDSSVTTTLARLITSGIIESNPTGVNNQLAYRKKQLGQPQSDKPVMQIESPKQSSFQ